jgi:DNA-binding MarR family transcriptional regulator
MPEPIRVASEHVSRVAAVRAVVRTSRLLERACGDLSLAHYRVLAAVSAGEQRASRVAERLAVGKPTISASVDALCRRGLLIRESSAVDQRVVALRLTPEGETVLAGAERVMLARLDAVLAHVDDRRAVVSALNALIMGLDRLADER